MLDIHIFQVLLSSESHSMTIVSKKIGTSPTFSFTVHSLIISFLSSGSIKVLGTELALSKYLLNEK